MYDKNTKTGWLLLLVYKNFFLAFSTKNYVLGKRLLSSFST
jgi:hypothetical protein